MSAKIKVFLLFAVCLFGVSTSTVPAQSIRPEQTQVDPQCVSDDENFTRFYDSWALAAAFLFFLAIPWALPLLPGVPSSWRFASAGARWLFSALILSSLLFLIPVFLLPQLARVSESFRPWGLWVPHSLGNIRLEYLQCDVQSVPKDYGLLFFAHLNPGPNLMISYWWDLLALYLAYAGFFTLIYFSLVRATAQLRFAALSR